MRPGRRALIALSFLLLAVVITLTDVDQTVAQAIKDVIVHNTPADPLWTRNLDSSTRQIAYNFSAVGTTQPGYTTGDVVLAIVRSGEQLVIEHVSVSADVPAGEQATAVIMARDAGGDVKWTHALVLWPQGHFVVGDFSRFAASQPVKIHVKGASTDTQIVVRLLRSSPLLGESAGFEGTISGYFVSGS